MNEINHATDKPLILLVDDDRATRLMLSHIMGKDNYAIAEAEDGAQALAVFEHLQPDLVIMDAMMPVMDGFTACARLHETLGEQVPPVLMLTNLEDHHSMELSFEVGATDFITKPIQWTVLRKRVNLLLKAGQNKALLDKMKENASSIISQSLDGIITLNPAGQIVSFNPAAEQIFGYLPEEIIGQEISKLMPNGMRKSDTTLPKDNPARRDEVINTSREVTGKRKDGSTFPVYLTISGYAAERLLTIRDITEHKQAEHKLRLAAKVLECMREGIVVADKNMLIQSVNPAFTTITGYSEGEVIGKNSCFLTSDHLANKEFYKKLAAFLRESGQYLGEFRLRRKNNQNYPARVSIRALSDEQNKITQYVAVITDITEEVKMANERKQFLEQTARAQKIASLGTMTAGIAHEINQPLNSIKVLADSMLYWQQRGRLPGPEKIASTLTKISHQVNRIDGIIKHLRTFISRDHVVELKPCDINNAIKGALELIGRQLSNHGIVVKKALAKKLPAALCNANRLEEAVINLLVNSMHSLNISNRASKEITCRTYLADEKVVLVISDNGTGIGDEIRELIFDPFFSTKHSGEGMGLGLTMVQSIINSCHGEIDLMNNELGGATFIIKLPIIQKDVPGCDQD